MTQAEFESTALTDAQREAMKNLQERSGISWEDFLERSSLPSNLFPVMIENFHGMTVGVEEDGYTHT